jgi:hypothetical protein
MDKISFINKVAKQISKNKCDIFIGSGISCASKVPSWFEFLKPLANDIDIELLDNDDLPLIAQYIVNNNSGNRNIIRSSLVEIFDKDYQINANHDAISTMNINTVWTTNYDCLLEKSFQNRCFHVISSDNDLGKPRNVNELEIIKIHGGIKEDLEEIILTQQDYDNFVFKKPAIAQRLRATLLEKSILFIGYGYRDANIRTVMVEAMKLVNNNSLEHYIIMDKPNKRNNESNEQFEQRKRRFDFWVKELNRLGIRELLIDSRAELPDVLNKISISSRGETVFVTGSHEIDNNDYVERFGKELAGIEKVILINGQSKGFGASVLNQFITYSINNKTDISSRIKLFPNPYAARPEYSNDSTLLPLLKKERSQMLSMVKVIVPFAGGMGTKAEVEVAKEKNCIIIPGITSINDYENLFLRELIEDKYVIGYLKNNIPIYFELLRNRKVPEVADLINAVEGVLI